MNLEANWPACDCCRGLELWDIYVSASSTYAIAYAGGGIRRVVVIK